MTELFDAVRKRPQMYVFRDSGDEDYHFYLIFYALRFSLDDFSRGYCENIRVILLEKGFIAIESDGLCLPMDIHPDMSAECLYPGKSNLPNHATIVECSLTQLVFTTNEFYRKYVVGGPWREGFCPINIYSSDCKVILWKDGVEWKQDYKDGLPVSEIEKIGPTTRAGMRVEFKPYSSMRPVKRDFTGIVFEDFCNWLESTRFDFLENESNLLDIPVKIVDAASNDAFTVQVKWKSKPG